MARGISPETNGGASLGSSTQNWANLFTQNITLSNNFDLLGSAIVAKSLSGGNGYIKYASGLIVQWGEVFPGSNTASFSADFPISFTGSQTYELTAIAQEGLSNLRIDSHSTASRAIFNFTNSATDARGIRWIAIGH